MKLYNTQKLNEVMQNVKIGTILFFFIKNDWRPFLPNTEIDFVKAVIMNEKGFKKIVHCNRFKLVQSAETNEWTIYNGENTDYEFLYAFEKLDEETYKLLGTVEDFYFQESLRWKKDLKK